MSLDLQKVKLLQNQSHHLTTPLRTLLNSKITNPLPMLFRLVNSFFVLLLISMVKLQALELFLLLILPHPHLHLLLHHRHYHLLLLLHYHLLILQLVFIYLSLMITFMPFTYLYYFFSNLNELLFSQKHLPLLPLHHHLHPLYYQLHHLKRIVSFHLIIIIDLIFVLLIS